MSNFFRNRAKNKHERHKKIKERQRPLNDNEKSKRTKKTKILSDDEIENVFDENKANEILNTLNKEQKEAALSNTKRNLVIASAGTGKTSTIVARVIHLLQNKTKPNEILLITFTSKAAQEMKDRIKRYIHPTIANEIIIGTFHATAIYLLKENGISFDLKPPKAMSTLMKLASSKYGLENKKLENENIYSESTILQLYQSFQTKANGKSFEDWYQETYEDNEIQFELLHHYETIFGLFEEILAKEGVIGFNELLILAREKSNTFKNTFKEIIIDEYQDTSYLQTNYIESLNHEKLFCVGDYDQSIYAFNGADISIIGSFKERYSDASVINLKKNYRSKKPILDLAQKSISINPRLFKKELEIMKTDESSPVEVKSFNLPEEQYEKIAEIIANKETKFSEIAILYRNNSSADKMEAELKSLNIDTVRYDSSSFFDIDEVGYTINILNLLESSDKLAFIDILNLYSLHGYSNNILDILASYGQNIADSIVFPKNNFKFSALDSDEFFRKHFLASKIQSRKISNLIYELYKIIISYKKLNKDDFLDNLFKSGLIIKGMEKFAAIKSKRKGKIDEEKYETNLKRSLDWQRTLQKTIKNYDSVKRFLQSLQQKSADNEKSDGVRLITVHGSKGLEYSEVFILDLNEGKFPNTRLMNDGGGGLEEERRLFYVAVTRAKDMLTLSYSKMKNKTKADVPSIFLTEIGLVEGAKSSQTVKKIKKSKKLKNIEIQKPINDETQEIDRLLKVIKTSFENWREVIKDEFKIDTPLIHINFQLASNRTLGSISRHPKKEHEYKMNLNKSLLLKYKEEYIEHTVRHEFGHAVAMEKYDDSIKDHGKEWKDIMIVLGDNKPSATTNRFEIDHQGYIWDCACKKHIFLKRKHNSILESGASCKKCGEKLLFSGEFQDISKSGKITTRKISEKKAN